jgi:hypothetical protein
LTGKCFPLTNFSNDKQTQESLESDFLKNEFRETNMALINICGMRIKAAEANMFDILINGEDSQIPNRFKKKNL